MKTRFIVLCQNAFSHILPGKVASPKTLAKSDDPNEDPNRIIVRTQVLFKHI